VLSTLGLVFGIEVVHLTSHCFENSISVKPIFEGLSSSKFSFFCFSS
jgi:hypothetical protein